MNKPTSEQLNEKLQLNIDVELKIFVETILEQCEFLAACQKSDSTVVDNIQKKIIKKFKITDSEVSFTSLEMQQLLEQINNDYIYKTILDLTDKNYLSLGISKDGEMTIEATQQMKEYMEFFEKKLDKKT
jgi:hypothetical protein